MTEDIDFFILEFHSKILHAICNGDFLLLVFAFFTLGVSNTFGLGTASDVNSGVDLVVGLIVGGFFLIFYWKYGNILALRINSALFRIFYNLLNKWLCSSSTSSYDSPRVSLLWKQRLMSIY